MFNFHQGSAFSVSCSSEIPPPFPNFRSIFQNTIYKYSQFKTSSTILSLLNYSSSSVSSNSNQCMEGNFWSELPPLICFNDFNKITSFCNLTGNYNKNSLITSSTKYRQASSTITNHNEIDQHSSLSIYNISLITSSIHNNLVNPMNDLKTSSLLSLLALLIIPIAFIIAALVYFIKFRKNKVDVSSDNLEHNLSYGNISTQSSIVGTPIISRANSHQLDLSDNESIFSRGISVNSETPIINEDNQQVYKDTEIAHFFKNKKKEWDNEFNKLNESITNILKTLKKKEEEC